MSFSRQIYCILRNNITKKTIFSNKFPKRIHTSNIHPANVSFNLSDIGEGIREVVVKEWFVKVGDEVSQFDNICEVQSDKASVTITSRYDGVVKKLYYQIDETALVGKPLVDIDTKETIDSQGTDADVVEETVLNSSPVIENADVNANSTTNKNELDVAATLCIPSVRRLAKEYKVDLSQIKGTGKQGRILKEDILKYLEIGSAEEIKNKSQKIPALNIIANNKETSKTVRIEGFKKAMVKSMTKSLEIPHFVYSDEIAVTKLSDLREKLKLEENTKLSLMAFFIKAISNCLQRFPILNASVDDNCENITYKHYHNISVAMDTKMGLAVPVIKNIETLSIMEINNELNRLIKSGKAGIFSPNDLSGGTFSLSNIGIIGGTYTSPVIAPPQVGIVAIGAVQKLPRFNQSNDVIAENIINISAAADHRVIDGATMARFIEQFKKQIENPYLLFLNL